MAAVDRLERGEVVRFCNHQDKLIEGHRDLNQGQLIDLTLDKAEIGGAIEHGAGNLDAKGTALGWACKYFSIGVGLVTPGPLAATALRKVSNSAAVAAGKPLHDQIHFGAVVELELDCEPVGTGIGIGIGDLWDPGRVGKAHRRLNFA
jgi:hypothetical protein